MHKYLTVLLLGHYYLHPSTLLVSLNFEWFYESFPSTSLVMGLKGLLSSFCHLRILQEPVKQIHELQDYKTILSMSLSFLIHLNFSLQFGQSLRLLQGQNRNLVAFPSADILEESGSQRSVETVINHIG